MEHEGKRWSEIIEGDERTGKIKDVENKWTEKAGVQPCIDAEKEKGTTSIAYRYVRARQNIARAPYG